LGARLASVAAILSTSAGRGSFIPSTLFVATQKIHSMTRSVPEYSRYNIICHRMTRHIRDDPK
jgi:hypothetical protein